MTGEEDVGVEALDMEAFRERKAASRVADIVEIKWCRFEISGQPIDYYIAHDVDFELTVQRVGERSWEWSTVYFWVDSLSSKGEEAGDGPVDAMASATRALAKATASILEFDAAMAAWRRRR